MDVYTEIFISDDLFGDSNKTAKLPEEDETKIAGGQDLLPYKQRLAPQKATAFAYIETKAEECFPDDLVAIKKSACQS